MASKTAGQLIKRDDDGKKWLIRVYMGRDAAGKRLYHNETFHGNKTNAQKRLNKILREKDTGEFIVDAGDESLESFLNRWLENTIKTRVREKTYLDYKSRMKLYVIPAIGTKKLSQITPDMIEDIYSDMQNRGLSPRTVRYTHTILKNGLKEAVIKNKIYRNPADLVSNLPRQVKQEMKYLTPEQASKFMEAIAYSEHKAFFNLLISTGIRPGEALGLKWTDVDLKENRITINRTLTTIPGRGWKLEETKTARSRRTIPITSAAAAKTERA